MCREGRPTRVEKSVYRYHEDSEKAEKVTMASGEKNLNMIPWGGRREAPGSRPTDQKRVKRRPGFG